MIKSNLIAKLVKELILEPVLRDTMHKGFLMVHCLVRANYADPVMGVRSAEETWQLIQETVNGEPEDKS